MTDDELALAQVMLEQCVELAGGDVGHALKIACEAAVTASRAVSAGYVRALPPAD